VCGPDIYLDQGLPSLLARQQWRLLSVRKEAVPKDRISRQN
jgi:hypothetical protein